MTVILMVMLLMMLIGTVMMIGGVVPGVLVAASGSVAGVTAADAVEALLVPTLFVAVTVNVYGVPFARPVTVHESAPIDHEHVPPELAVTVYAKIAAPPESAGALHDTTTCVLPLTPVTLVGAGGASAMRAVKVSFDPALVRGLVVPKVAVPANCPVMMLEPSASAETPRAESLLVPPALVAQA